MKTLRSWSAFGSLSLLVSLGLGACGRPQALRDSGAAPMAGPHYTAEGKLLLPEGYAVWPLAGASIGLSYSEGARSEGPGMFHNVYLEPEAYRIYARTGEFPEKTMLVLAQYDALACARA